MEKLELGAQISIVPELVNEWMQLLAFYKPPSTSSANLINAGTLSRKQVPSLTKDIKITEKAKLSIAKLSKTLSLDQIQTYQIYISYVKTQIALKMSEADNLGNDIDDSLQMDIFSYYSRERQATIMLITALIRYKF